MKPEDMLPPGIDIDLIRRFFLLCTFVFFCLEEKEKRKDEFEKEVQMIIKAGEQTAEEMARRAQTKNTRQGLVDNDAILPAFKSVRNLLILINSLISFLFCI